MTKFEALRESLPDLVSHYYSNHPYNAAGGNLHIALDDGNLDNSSIEFCRENAEKDDDLYGVFICDVLLRIPTEGEREKALRPYLYDYGNS